MGGPIGFIAFVSFTKKTIIEGNQNGIGWAESSVWSWNEDQKGTVKAMINSYC